MYANNNVDRQYMKFNKILNYLLEHPSFKEINTCGITDDEKDIMNTMLVEKIQSNPDILGYNYVNISIINIALMVVVGIIRFCVKNTDNTFTGKFDHDILQEYDEMLRRIFQILLTMPEMETKKKYNYQKINVNHEKNNEYYFMLFKLDVVRYSTYFIF